MIKLKLTKGEDGIIIHVKDDGPGIPETIKDNLFKGQVASQSGLGLGLFLSEKMLKTLGGLLQLQTSRKRGTTFTILLPTAIEGKES